MSNQQEPENLAFDNERSLQTLVRTITLSQGTFSLILLRCNYADLRQRIVERLHQLSTVHIGEITLPASVKTLYTNIREQLGDEQPPALMIFGLESVKDIDTVLTSANQVREEFRKNFPFPILLWVNDSVLQKFIRLATDLENWATIIEFEKPTDELVNFLQQKSDEIFADDITLNPQMCRELETARQDLQNRGEVLEAALQASLEYLLGLNDYLHDHIDSALAHYQQSLEFWRQSNDLERQGILLVNIASAYNRQSEKNQTENQRYWQESKNYFQHAIEIFEQAQRSDLVAKHITKLGEVLRRLQAWPELQSLVEKSLPLHQNYGTSLQLAQDYGFLAEVALEQSQWDEAHKHAQQALQILAAIPNLQPDQFALYRFILAKSQQGLGQVQAAITNLEAAKNESNHHYNPQLYISILERLRLVYFEQCEYLKAFNIKQERLQIEQQYGFRAFVGASYLNPQRQAINSAQLQVENPETIAQEIAASGRGQDVKRLRERIGGTEHKLTVIHGQSGVGKSSILQGGLIPALQQEAIGERDALPILLRVYTDWVGMLGQSLVKAFEEVRGNQLFVNLDSSAAILEQLRKNADRNLLTILMFDQFEEFFFVYPNQSQRRAFYEFLRVCLDIPFVKVILSLREDYLHYLLELERLFNLTAINNNILDKSIRYYLGNFSPNDAKAVVQSLTKRSQFYLEPALIDELVQDLAGELAEVRPIELQIVGTQLQTEKITTLDKYRQFGTKEKLVERFLEEVIHDCGAENKQVARLILYLLTDESGTRPLKTRAELATDLAAEADKLDLVLEIFVASRLVLLLPESPADRYQLVHDYLVSFIRRQQQGSDLLAELAQIRQQQKLTEEELNRSLKRRLRDSYIAGVAVALFAVLAMAFGIRAEDQKRQLEISQILALSASSKALFTSNQEIEALTEGLRVGRRLKQSTWVDDNAKILVLTALQQAVDQIRERNRLVGHTDIVWGLSFSPNGQVIASGGRDSILKLWSSNGRLLKNIKVHSAITNLNFSPDGQMIATASLDGIVKLWSSNGVLLQTLRGHSNSVYDVGFSPDGKTLVSASRDKTLKIWSRNGSVLKTLRGHSSIVNSVSFSPDGKTIASASDDKTVKLWSTDGTLLKTLRGHSEAVMDVSFSPDGKTIASASRDKTVKLWNRYGKFLQTLQGHTNIVWDVNFSPNSQIIASSGGDGLVKLWSRDGNELISLKHNDDVTTVRFSPDGQMLASASFDKTVKVWSVDNSLKTLRGHSKRINSVSFNPDSKTLATASNDQTVKLWNRNGTLLKTLNGHSGSVSSVIFSPDGYTIATASKDKTVKLWNHEGTLLKTLNGHSSWVNMVRFSADGQTIASASNDKTIKLWRRNGTILKTLAGHSDIVNSVSFSPDGKIIASASDDKTIKLWKNDGTLLKTLQAHSKVISVSFSPNGQVFASANLENTVQLWTHDGILLKTLIGHNDTVNSVSFSPDSKMLVSGSWDKTVRLWGIDGSLLYIFTGHKNGILDVSFSPDGKTIASASVDNTVILRNLDFNLDKLLARGCAWLHDYLQTNPNVTDSDRHLCEDIK
ncbi:eIF2A-related protein [Nostoc sp. ChiVER01]|uniref:WD40 domain-containing protein n=1 Tax=Nostoc sp. ChiVER01 TaxID=3075382 RepID=UPI002AD22B5E|nr:tetratricopeptide repeat protein [Nostoc sp. ChiVER01]MDZ8222587.1 tetratricopeptide repeat protein [Nostoc sp. ChiVER01]